mgnify:CR=1 FL=1
MDEHTLKAQLLGTMKPRPVTGAFQPDREELLQPLEGPDSVAHGFCQGCNMTFEITAQGKKLFSEDFSIRIPENLGEQYVHFSRCIWCDTRYRDPEVRDGPR